jgi:hypothetical protein
MSSDTADQQGIPTSCNTSLPDVCIITSENQPLLPPSTPTTPNMELVDNPHSPPWNTNITDDYEYADIIKQSERAIEGGILPVRIPAGSSGSYFVRNLEGVSDCFSCSTSILLFVESLEKDWRIQT